MECPICMNAVDETTSATRLTCGHTFHFGCLATWATTAQTCPMCRHTFGDTESVERAEPLSMNDFILTGVGGQGRMGFFQTFFQTNESRRPTPAEVAAMFERLNANRRPTLRETLTSRYRARPIEQYTGQTPDPLDIMFVMENAHVSWETAKCYLQYYRGDAVEAILCFDRGEEMPIPEYQHRQDRPVLEEPYVSRTIASRVGMTARTLEMVDDRGYESV